MPGLMELDALFDSCKQANGMLDMNCYFAAMNAKNQNTFNTAVNNQVGSDEQKGQLSAFINQSAGQLGLQELPLRQFLHVKPSIRRLQELPMVFFHGGVRRNIPDDQLKSLGIMHTI